MPYLICSALIFVALKETHDIEDLVDDFCTYYVAGLLNSDSCINFDNYHSSWFMLTSCTLKIIHALYNHRVSKNSTCAMNDILVITS